MARVVAAAPSKGSRFLTFERRFLEEVATCEPARVVRRSDGTIEELIFEWDVDGAHYTVTRSYHAVPDSELSPREREIARLVAKGLPNKAIGAALDISAWTVATHLRRIFVKLGVTCRAAMVAHLMERGMLGLPEPRQQGRAASNGEQAENHQDAAPWSRFSIHADPEAESLRT